MIIVDTNVWSEALKPEPNQTVLEWLRLHSNEATLTAVSVFEMRYGASILPPGSRQTELQTQIDSMISAMSARTLNYDATAATAHARFAASARVDGRALSREDGQLLGIAAANGCKIATHNVRDFEGFGVEIIDPWLKQTAA
ncbi:type II toxin-antitoxin system VapC family toxin [Leucobacter viscericola]|uniref:Ribonuclease VapC n=1 Tax=Leucobacter viscericola TaxID=2714935 RepID=A0A6G7XD01_9MICO|nr:PIN domain-containing protein [Leucobacter viscericola]QIK62382.1 type II toxin-antitoxin system VapC family toxin [Leucobacter viscericola]